MAVNKATVNINISVELNRIAVALAYGHKVWGSGVDGEKVMVNHHGNHEHIYRVFHPQDVKDPVSYHATPREAAWAMLQATNGNSLFTIEERQ